MNPAASINNYVNYLKKTCYPQPTTWETPALTNIINGIRLEGAATRRFPNFIGSSTAVNITNRESGRSEFAQMAYISFLPIRVPSEALSLIRAYKRGELTESAPQDDHAVIGIRFPHGVIF